jgi:hypothetical protein
MLPGFVHVVVRNHAPKDPVRDVFWGRLKAKVKFHEGFGLCDVANRENLSRKESGITVDELFLFFSDPPLAVT